MDYINGHLVCHLVRNLALQGYRQPDVTFEPGSYPGYLVERVNVGTVALRPMGDRAWKLGDQASVKEKMRGSGGPWGTLGY